MVIPVTAGFRSSGAGARRRRRLALLLGGGRIEALELHLDVPGRVEGELPGLERRRGAVAARRELDDDGLVALDERVDEQLVRAGLEVEVSKLSTLRVIAIGVK
jgi:hypothetical protein